MRSLARLASVVDLVIHVMLKTVCYLTPTKSSLVKQLNTTLLILSSGSQRQYPCQSVAVKMEVSVSIEGMMRCRLIQPVRIMRWIVTGWVLW